MGNKTEHYGWTMRRFSPFYYLFKFTYWLKATYIQQTALPRRNPEIEPVMKPSNPMGSTRNRKRRRQKKREKQQKVWLFSATIVVLLAIIGVLLARGYLRLAEKMDLTTAQLLLAKGDYAGAMASATKALNINSTDVNACVVMADASEMAHLRTEWYWVQQLANLNPTVENKLRLAETGLR